MGTTAWWGDGSALYEGLMSLSFPSQGSRGAKGAKVSLCFCTIYSFWLMPGAGGGWLEITSSWSLFSVSG